MENLEKGICYIKSEYLIADKKDETLIRNEKVEAQETETDMQEGTIDAAETKKDETCVPEVITEATETENNVEESEEINEGIENADKNKKLKRKFGVRGQYKYRPIYKEPREVNLCYSLYNGPNDKKCENPKCVFIHDLEKYLEMKPKDISDKCYIYSTKGFCRTGLACRFKGAHVDANLNNLKADKYNPDDPKTTFNGIYFDLQMSLKKRQYKFDKSSETMVAKFQNLRNERTQKPKKIIRKRKLLDGLESESNSEEESESEQRTGCVLDEDEIPLNEREKKKVDFRNKIILSPLTTVGNLPFRRICKDFGADITCGEMACVVPILRGGSQEWAMTKRHECEDVFGVQICGNNALLITRAAQLIKENTNADFIDLNIGCPIDWVFDQGGGSALMRRENVLEVAVRSCSQLLDIPFTVKTRTGVYAHKNLAHDLIPKLEKWGASAVTLHGRSREQRYIKSANWEYIEECASKVKNMPVIGNGDILNYEDYNEAKKIAPHVSSVMIGRGALIKPWIFKEIKEQKHWDPSSSERLDILQKYVNYGLEHWGSDTKGVEITRRFLLEWQSFFYRYVPLSLLEYPPQKINQRPQKYRGRDDLETLLNSNNCSDWIKISEMLLGPVPPGFTFLPKHKANAY